jgi:hypothetical protein
MLARSVKAGARPTGRGTEWAIGYIGKLPWNQRETARINGGDGVEKSVK